MIVHCVFCRVEDAVLCAKVIDELETFSRSLAGVISFEGGPNCDFEHKSPGFEQGFVIRFRDAEALRLYAKHPVHQALGAKLVSCCSGGLDGIVVFDIESS